MYCLSSKDIYYINWSFRIWIKYLKNEITLIFFWTVKDLIKCGYMCFKSVIFSQKEIILHAVTLQRGITCHVDVIFLFFV